MNTNFNDIQKIIIAPQIVVYRNIFKHSQELINLLKEDNGSSYFGNWNAWYEQGFRKGADPKLFDKISLSNNKQLDLEMQYISEVNDCMNFIRNDYLNDFDKYSGIWPSFIENWDSLKNTNNKYYIDFFRYEIEKEMIPKPSGLIMEYHVDEIPVPGEIKKDRHVATVNFYLNNEYDGGEICVYDSISNKSYMYKPFPGDAVIMPSTEPFYHGVKAFKNFDRYFMRAFIDTPVSQDTEWTKKYELNIDPSIINSVRTEDDYVAKELQTIKLSIPPELIEIKGN